MLLSLVSFNASAQWTVNGTTPVPDLETNTTVPSTWNNVIIDNHLGINVATTGCPVTPGSTLMEDYPLVVNALIGGGSPFANGTAIVLWDKTGDARRKVVGLSQNSGIGMFSGNGITNGSSIFLNAPGTTGTLHPQGSVHGFSIGDGLAGTRAFEQRNYNTSLPLLQNIFSLDQNGDARITGNLSFDLLGGDIDFRLIKGLSPGFGLNLTSATATDGSDGACCTAYGWNATPGAYPAGPYPGAFVITSNGGNACPPLGFAYKSYIAGGLCGSLGAVHDVFSVSKWGYGCFGMDMNLTNITSGDVFTVKDAFGFYDQLDATTRLIHGNTNAGDLSIYSNNSIAGTSGGSNIDLYGLANYPNYGRIVYTSNTSSTPGGSAVPFTGYPSMVFTNDDGVTQTNNFVISDNGHGIFGHNTNLGNIAGGTSGAGDIFTVKDALGFYDAVDANPRSISGNTSAGELGIASARDGTDGSAIGLYGATSPYPGAIHFVSKGTAGESMLFCNYSATGWHGNMQISNIGQTVVGHDLYITDAVVGDVLTVKDQMGFYDVNDATTRKIDGNTSAGYLSLSSNTNGTNGSAITLSGLTSANPSQLTLSSVGTTGTLATFDNYNGGTYHHNLQVGKNGQTVVGPDMTLPLAASADILTVEQEIGFYSSSSSSFRAIHGNAPGGTLAINENTNYLNGPILEMYGPSTPLYSGEHREGRIGMESFGTYGYGFMFSNTPDAVHFNNQMAITKDGRVIIGKGLLDLGITHAPNGPGTSSPQYSLYVQYGILTEQVRVALNGSAEWADYVFAGDYKLMPLNKLEKYVNKHKHLPDVPSAEDVKNDGIDLGTMDAKLLKKIEELTLYVINQDKRIDELQKKLDGKNKN